MSGSINDTRSKNKKSDRKTKANSKRNALMRRYAHERNHMNIGLLIYTRSAGAGAGDSLYTGAALNHPIHKNG